MCGIFGCVGLSDCVPVVIDGLSFLEYRGYDSSGIAVVSSSAKRIDIVKKAGRVSVMRKAVTSSASLISGSPCIGHTRWATHGSPDDKNAHPFVSNDETLALVHNGVIENYLSLKRFLVENGFSFSSETDSEVIVNLIQYYHKGDILRAISDTVTRLKGSFAIALVSSCEENKIFFAKRNNPLVAALDNGFGYVCSDFNGLSARVKECLPVPDGTLGFVTPFSVRLFSKTLEELPLDFVPVSSSDAFSLQGYPHYMLKEIHETPDAVARALTSYDTTFDTSIVFGVKRIVFIGCGTALHACLVALRVLRELAPLIDCYAVAASEFLFSEYPVRDALFVAVTQSGETADTIAAVKCVKSRGGRVVAICNVPCSTVSRIADKVIYTNAGPEISVASTKAYSAQIACLISTCIDTATVLNPDFPTTTAEKLRCELRSVPSLLARTIVSSYATEKIAKENATAKNVFYIGRGIDYCVAKEGSLKLKEISYVRSEAYAAGELKHGSLALIEKGVLVVAIITQEKTLEKNVTNLAEVKSRGAKTIVITPFCDEKVLTLADYPIIIPKINDLLSPLTSVIPTQLFAYYSALFRKCDIDRPRNLAKSVTVE